jgi:hypothetical protein
MLNLSHNKKGYIKKNWTEEEASLLRWSVATYIKKRGISNQQLVSKRKLLMIIGDE